MMNRMKLVVLLLCISLSSLALAHSTIGIFDIN